MNVVKSDLRRTRRESLKKNVRHKLKLRSVRTYPIASSVRDSVSVVRLKKRTTKSGVDGRGFPRKRSDETSSFLLDFVKKIKVSNYFFQFISRTNLFLKKKYIVKYYDFHNKSTRLAMGLGKISQ